MKKTWAIKKRFDFKKTLNYGQYVKGKYISVYILPIKKPKDICDSNLFGVCVSKKNGNSVTRNRLKRWAREAYRTVENKLKQGNYIIVLYRKDIKEKYDSGNVDYEGIKKDVIYCAGKLDAFKEEYC